MYNLNSHYENIFQYLTSIITEPRAIYLHPFGSTQPENIEELKLEKHSGPAFVFYDQEPIYTGTYNHNLFNYIEKNVKGPIVLVTTEQNSDPLNQIQQRYGWPTAYYFHHAFAAHDWFRGYRYNPKLIDPARRTLTKKYITFNRLTSGPRVYRSLLVSELAKRNILEHGYVSYNDTCPDGGSYRDNLLTSDLIPRTVADEAVKHIDAVDLPLRIDYKNQNYTPNQSFVLSAVEQTQESFMYLVTETCYWDRKDHLTEKVFKPIVSQMPFVMVGPAHSLKYLRSYGFKTFDYWLDEGYDEIEDPFDRMQAVTDLIEKICRYDIRDLEDMLKEMRPTLDHNYRRFYSNGFLDQCWRELRENLSHAIS